MCGMDGVVTECAAQSVGPDEGQETTIDVDPSILYIALHIACRHVVSACRHVLGMCRILCRVWEIDCWLAWRRLLSTDTHRPIASCAELAYSTSSSVSVFNQNSALFYAYIVRTSSCHRNASQRCHVRLFVHSISSHLTEIAPPARHLYSI